MELLWTNPSPMSQVTTLTFSDIKNYAFLCIDCKREYSDTVSLTDKNDFCRNFVEAGSNNLIGYTRGLFRGPRGCTYSPDSSGLYIGTASSASQVIPLRIWGVA